jgi:hypothetical protein
VKTIMLVENDQKEGLHIKQWIETVIADSQVLWFHNTQDAEKKLKEYTTVTGVIECIVLDMWFPSSFRNKEEPLGMHILDLQLDIPIVLIYKEAETWNYTRARDDVPLIRLDKPVNWFSVSNPGVELLVQEFRRDLVEAVKCALLVASLRTEVERLRGRQVLRPIGETRVFWAAIVFGACVVLYGISIPYLVEWVQHFLLALCAVMFVHLLDRAVLFKDFRDAFKSVSKQLAELSVLVQRSAQEGKGGSESIDRQLAELSAAVHQSTPKGGDATQRSGGDATSE